MRQKYTLTIIPETQKLAIREYAEIEKEEFAFVCEEIHDVETFKDAMSEGAVALVPIVRRPNMYPRHDFSERIAQGIIELINDDAGVTSSEIMINDIEAFESSEDDIDPDIVLDEEDGSEDLDDPDVLDMDDSPDVEGENKEKD